MSLTPNAPPLDLAAIRAENDAHREKLRQHGFSGTGVPDTIDALLAEVERLREQLALRIGRERAAEDQLLWLSQWCKRFTGVENNAAIGRDGWPSKLVEVVAKSVEDHVTMISTERDAAREDAARLAMIVMVEIDACDFCDPEHAREILANHRKLVKTWTKA